MWIREYKRAGESAVSQAALHQKLLKWEEGWVRDGLTGLTNIPKKRDESRALRKIVEDIRRHWADELGIPS